MSATEPVIYALLLADDITDLTNTVRSIRQNEHIMSAKVLIGGYHKYFSSYRYEKLVEMVKSGSR